MKKLIIILSTFIFGLSASAQIKKDKIFVYLDDNRLDKDELFIDFQKVTNTIGLLTIENDSTLLLISEFPNNYSGKVLIELNPLAKSFNVVIKDSSEVIIKSNLDNYMSPFHEVFFIGKKSQKYSAVPYRDIKSLAANVVSCSCAKTHKHFKNPPIFSTGYSWTKRDGLIYGVYFD